MKYSYYIIYHVGIPQFLRRSFFVRGVKKQPDSTSSPLRGKPLEFKKTLQKVGPETVGSSFGKDLYFSVIYFINNSRVDSYFNGRLDLQGKWSEITSVKFWAIATKPPVGHPKFWFSKGIARQNPLNSGLGIIGSFAQLINGLING